MNLKLNLITLGISVSCLAAFGQTPTLPTVIPTSPSSSALQKYAEYPVSLNTGTIDISVPIYNISVDDINVPIELKYHSSGIRYDDDSKNIGIGWTLFAGGMVTGVQMGIPDMPGPNNFFKSAGSMNTFDDGSTTYNDNQSLINVIKGISDSQYDVFNYSFLNYSGKFFFPGTSNAVLTPRRNFQVTCSSTAAGGMGSKGPITIVDENGISYRFGADRTGNTITAEPSGTTTSVVDFMLTEIISADKSDTVRFNYTVLPIGFVGSDQMAGRLLIDDNVVIRDQLQMMWDGSAASGDSYTTASSSGHIRTGYTYCRLDNVTFRTGKVVFSYDSSNRLTGTTIFNAVDTAPVRSVTFCQSPYGEYYKLDSVRFRDASLSKSYSYRFGYQGVPYPKVSGLDYWGYYNGTSAPLNYVPNFTTAIDGTITAVGSADRTPNETAMQQGVLNAIYYPTRGHSIFTYEAHRYNSYSGIQIAGGLRIKSIANYDANNNFIGMKWYKYGVSENGYGQLYKDINPDDYCFNALYAVSDADKNVTAFDYTFRERTYNAFPAFNNITPGSSVTYPEVAEYNGDGTNANGKTIYQYENFPDIFGYGVGNASIPMITYDYNWKNGNLVGKYVYKLDGGNYSLISSEQNTYKDLHDTTYLCLKAMRYIDWRNTSYVNGNAYTYEECMDYPNNPQAYPIYTMGIYPNAYANYWLTTGIRVLDSQLQKKDGVTRSINYTYDNTYDKPRTVTATESDGTNRITQYTYAFDKAGSIYNGMVAANIISPVVEQDDYKSSLSNFLSSTTTDWDNWGGTFFKPLTLSTKVGSANSEVRIRYGAYDDLGNLKTVAKENGPKITYIWSYNGAYPVAEIHNADYNSVEAALGGSSAVAGFRDSNPTDASLNAFLAPLRSSPTLAGALITTYTYDPLVGMTSMTDAKGETTYYEYDSFQRLKNIKDKNGNIIKHIDYHYQGQN